MLKNALIAGATGLVGSELVQILIKSDYYNSIHVLGRRPYHLQHLKMKSYIIDFDKLEDFQSDALIHDVYICLGTTMKKAGSKENFRKVDFGYIASLGRWAKNNKVERICLISSVGANPHSANFYLKTKGEAEEVLKALHFRNLIIMRPSLLLGKRAEFRFAEKSASMMAGFLKLITRGRLMKYTPVEASEVAAAMFHLTRNASGPLLVAGSAEILKIAQ